MEGVFSFYSAPNPSNISQRGPPPAPSPEPPTATLPPPGFSDTVASTLLVRHLPEAIPEEILSRLFSHYGASALRTCAGGRLKNCAFVDFKDESSATQAQLQLHRLKFLGKVLSVERSGKPSFKDINKNSDGQDVKGSHLSASLSKDSPSNCKHLIADGEPIATRLGVDYPFPQHLEYQYPQPDGNILTNIVNALIAVPRFYTQVLHLMNKMNIPAPFRMALPTPPLPPAPQVPPPLPPAPPPLLPQPPMSARSHTDELSSDESELESEEDSIECCNRKRAKRQAIVGPGVDKNVSYEDVGVKPVNLIPKEVPVIKKKNTVLQIKIAPKPAQKELIVDDCSMKENDYVKESLEHKPYVTQQEIESSKLPPEEILSLPMFKNYSAGNPASVLYIKNLAKEVTMDDFYLIFGSLFGSVEAARSSLNVKLMQEGRMRGQAFVTFPSTDLAHRALILLHGYVFKGKPIIIHFGRTLLPAKPK